MGSRRSGMEVVARLGGGIRSPRGMRGLFAREGGRRGMAARSEPRAAAESVGGGTRWLRVRCGIVVAGKAFVPLNALFTRVGNIFVDHVGAGTLN